jgi:hypothetical protein
MVLPSLRDTGVIPHLASSFLKQCTTCSCYRPCASWVCRTTIAKKAYINTQDEVCRIYQMCATYIVLHIRSTRFLCSTILGWPQDLLQAALIIPHLCDMAGSLWTMCIVACSLKYFCSLNWSCSMRHRGQDERWVRVAEAIRRRTWTTRR